MNIEQSGYYFRHTMEGFVKNITLDGVPEFTQDIRDARIFTYFEVPLLRMVTTYNNSFLIEESSDEAIRNADRDERKRLVTRALNREYTSEDVYLFQLKYSNSEPYYGIPFNSATFAKEGYKTVLRVVALEAPKDYVNKFMFLFAVEYFPDGNAPTPAIAADELRLILYPRGTDVSEEAVTQVAPKPGLTKMDFTVSKQSIPVNDTDYHQRLRNSGVSEAQIIKLLSRGGALYRTYGRVTSLWILTYLRSPDITCTDVAQQYGQRVLIMNRAIAKAVHDIETFGKELAAHFYECKQIEWPLDSIGMSGIFSTTAITRMQSYGINTIQELYAQCDREDRVLPAAILSDTKTVGLNTCRACLSILRENGMTCKHCSIE